MQIAPPGDDWDAFCREQPSAYFWHTTDWTAYQFHARPGGENLHFTVREGRELLAVIPLVREGESFTLSGAPCWGPAIGVDLPEATALKVARVAFEHVDALAAEHGVTRAAFQLSPLAARNDFAGVAAIQAGYLDIGRTSQVLDLTVGVEQLLSEVPRKPRAHIRKGVEQYPVAAGTSHAALHEFRRLHEAAAGRATRPPETYDRWAAWAQRGDAVAFLSEDAGAIFLVVFGGRAYYVASANNPAHSRGPIGHALQWAAIEWLVAHGATAYEVGLQDFGPRLHAVPDEKARNISTFKRSFGGVPRLAPAYEKWYSADAFRAAYDARAEDYAAALTTRETSSEVMP